MAHALCPYCFPDDPRETFPEGTPLARWCGEEVPLSHDPVPEDARRCEKCQTTLTCGVCGAQMTFLGVLPPPKERSDG